MRISDWSSDVCSSDLTSAEVPAVVGIRISGGLGTCKVSTPSNSRILRPWATTMPMPLPQSMGLPPPTATMTSQWFSRYSRSEEHTSELQSLMRISYAVLCLKKKNKYKILIEFMQYIHQIATT